MSDGSEAPAERDVPGPPPPPGRRLSNLLVFSIVLSLLGSLMVGILGPLVGLALAIVGRKKVKQDPNLIGPRFAMICIWFAVFLIPLNGWLMYKAYHRQMFWVGVFKTQGTVFEGVKAGDYTKAWEAMSPEYRDGHTLDEFGELWKSVLPPETTFEITREHPGVRIEEIDEKVLRKRLDDFFSVDDGEISFVWPRSLKVGEVSLNVDISVHVKCQGYGEYVVRLEDLTIAEAPPEEKPAEEQPK